jgi:spore maturation protein CgeB
MGTYAADRQAKVDELFLAPVQRMPGTEFVLSGALYPWHWQWPVNVRRFDHIAPADHAAFYSSSRATLNITREGMARWGYCPSGRLYEAAACGTAILSDRWEGLDSFFKDGEEILLVERAEDVMAALESSDEELGRIAQRGRERTLDEHTGERRAEQLIAYLEEGRVAQPPSARPSATRFSEVAS